jgi:hypothetical protein
LIPGDPIVYKGKMKSLTFTLCLALLLATAALAKPQAELLGRLLAIADADQVKAFQQLQLSPEQVEKLRAAAHDFLPRVEQVKSVPGGQIMLVPEALSRVDSILTPKQRPLARKLVPRSHQWAKLKALYHEYQP